jgi:cytochrome b6-f complex iron-sulfur subunit
MADESKAGANKPSTKDILAAARAEAAKKAGSAPSAAPQAEAPAVAPASEQPAAAIPAVAKPAGGAKPKSTADILAAARAQAGDAAAPAAKSAPADAPAAAKPAAGGKPKSTADILAAARAGSAAKGAPPAAPAAEKPAPKAKPAAPVAPADTASPGLSVQEMLAAVRPAGAEVPAVAPVAKPPKSAASPMPAKPMPSAKKAPAGDDSRRSLLWIMLLSPFALAWWLMGLTTTVFALATARFMMPNVLTEPPRKFKIGPATDYDLGTVATKLVAQYGVWIVHTDQYKGRNVIYALASVCTHLGCTPSWLEGEQKFKCPCHGSGFYITGINFEGPAPRPLERVGIRLAPDGMLEVDKSLKFQEEMGQWADPASYYEVVG